jgi:hypothetical protein
MRLPLTLRLSWITLPTTLGIGSRLLRPFPAGTPPPPLLLRLAPLRIPQHQASPQLTDYPLWRGKLLTLVLWRTRRLTLGLHGPTCIIGLPHLGSRHPNTALNFARLPYPEHFNPAAPQSASMMMLPRRPQDMPQPCPPPVA